MIEDHSNGYDAIADEFMAARSSSSIELISDWAGRFRKGSRILDVGAGHGIPVTRALVEAGLDVFAIEASPRLMAALRRNLPGIQTACEPAQTSTFFDQSFDGVVAIGLVFLMDEAAQGELLGRMAKALKPGGRLLFSAPHQTGTWSDLLTGLPSLSLGRQAYLAHLSAQGLTLIAEHTDSGGSNHYEAVRT